MNRILNYVPDSSLQQSLDNSGIELSQELNKYPYNTQTVIKDYLKSTDKAINKNGAVTQALDTENNPDGMSLASPTPKNSIHQNEENVNEISGRSPLGDSLKQVMQEKYGLYVEEYIRQLLVDLNGGVRGYNSLGGLDALLTTFKKVSTMASLSVVIQQPSALPRAMSIINPKHFAHMPKLNNMKSFETAKSMLK